MIEFLGQKVERTIHTGYRNKGTVSIGLLLYLSNKVYYGPSETVKEANNQQSS